MDTLRIVADAIVNILRTFTWVCLAIGYPKPSFPIRNNSEHTPFSATPKYHFVGSVSHQQSFLHTHDVPIHHGFPTTKRETMRTAPYCPGEVRLPAALAACGGIPEISHSQAVDCVAVVVGRWMRPIPQKKGCSQWSKWRTNEQFHELYIQVCFDRLLGQIVKSLLLNEMIDTSSFYRNLIHGIKLIIIEGSLEVKLPTIWTGEKQRWEESEKRRRKKIKKEKVSEERRSRCAKR